MKKVVFSLVVFIVLTTGLVYGQASPVKFQPNNTALLLWIAVGAIFTISIIAIVTKKFVPWVLSILLLFTLGNVFFYCWWVGVIYCASIALTRIAVVGIDGQYKPYIKTAFYGGSAIVMTITAIAYIYQAKILEYTSVGIMMVLFFSSLIYIIVDGKKRK